MNTILVVQKLNYKQYYGSNTQKFEVLIKFEPCIYLKLFLNFNNSEPDILVKSYLYKKKSVES